VVIAFKAVGSKIYCEILGAWQKLASKIVALYVPGEVILERSVLLEANPLVANQFTLYKGELIFGVPPEIMISIDPSIAPKQLISLEVIRNDCNCGGCDKEISSVVMHPFPSLYDILYKPAVNVLNILLEE
tara:strand:- start:30 stop:422 length:393 start_codon:yes stop_codon:yes gene_type:complete